MTDETARVCIKCGLPQPPAEFADNWRHRVNRCRTCLNAYQRYLRKLGKENRKSFCTNKNKGVNDEEN